MADPKDPKVDPRFQWVFKRMASSLTEPRYFDKLKITFFQDENGIAFVKQFLDETGYQVGACNCVAGFCSAFPSRGSLLQSTRADLSTCHSRL